MRFSSKAILVLSLAFTLSSCHPEPDPKPVSEVAKIVAHIKSGDIYFRFRNDLKAMRDGETDLGKKLAIEVVMTVLASSVRILMDDLIADKGSDASKAGELSALISEIDAVNDDTFLAVLGTTSATQIHNSLGELRLALVNAKSTANFVPEVFNDTAIVSGWQNSFTTAQTYSAKIKTDISQLLDLTQTFSAGQLTVTGMLTPLSKAASLNDGFRVQVSAMQAASKAKYDDWAKLKATAIRMDAMNQLIVEWMKGSPLSGVGYPPEILSDVVAGGPKQEGSCVPISHGDNAGTATGTVTGTISKDLPCVFASMDVIIVPPKPL